MPWQPPARRWVAIGAVMSVCAAGAAGLAVGSDHQDTPEVELNPKMDMTDVYAFPGSAPGRIVLVMNSRAFLTPGDDATFDPDLLYQFKIDNNGDAKEDKVIQVTFRGEGTAQQVQVRGPIAPPVVGAMMNEIADVTPAVTGALNSTLGTATNIQVFAGPRDDPFFLDLEAAFCTLPDRKPAGGALSGSCVLPPNPQGGFFRTPGVNYLTGYNVLTIVVELPSALLENGTPGSLGIWGTISR